MTRLRAFIAIEITTEAQRKLEAISGQLQTALKGAPVRWVPVKNMHLTVKFLGDIPLNSLEALKISLQTAAAGCSAFEMSLGQVGAFPSPKQPRVLIVKIQAPAQLAILQSAIEAECANLGFPREGRDFTPHLTLGRISQAATPQQTARIGQGLETAQVEPAGLVGVQAVHLFKSDLQPSGAVYVRLFTAGLKPVEVR